MGNIVCANNHRAELGGETEPGVVLASLSNQRGLQVQCQKIGWTEIEKTSKAYFWTLHMHAHACTGTAPPPRVHPLTKGGGREERWRGGGRKIEDEREKKRKGGGGRGVFTIRPHAPLNPLC